MKAKLCLGNQCSHLRVHVYIISIGAFRSVKFSSCIFERRYDELVDSVEDYVLDVLKDQLNRRQPMDNVSRNLLRLLTATCGYKELRLMAVQRLEMWLQNPKVSTNCF